MDVYDGKTLGKVCKRFRQEKTNYTQADVANELCYVKTNVSAFEQGRNNNANILLWYIMNGLDVRKEIMNDGKNI